MYSQVEKLRKEISSSVTRKNKKQIRNFNAQDKSNNNAVQFMKDYTAKPGTKGTNTNQKARDYANSSNSVKYKSYEQSFTYISDNGKKKNIRVHVKNPKPSTGEKYDAGHIHGKQNGGSGTDITNIFAQNREANRWDERGRKHTISKDSHTIKKGKNATKKISWRGMENKIKRKRDKYKKAIKAKFKGHK